MSSGEFTQLSLKGFEPEISDDVSDNELAMVTSFSADVIEKMADDDKEDLRASYRRVRGVLFDTDVNDHGHAMSAKALKYMESHFKRTKDVPYLHNFFADHDFMTVSAMLGRQIELKFDPKTEQMSYEAILNNKHPLVQRAELMKSVSGTIIRGALECNKCGDPYTGGWFPEPSCEHHPNGSDIYPVTHKAIHIETSFVTFPAYKKTSVEMFSNTPKFMSVLKEEFPDSGVPDERAEALAQLQSNGSIETPNTEDEPTETVTGEDTQAKINQLMSSLSKIADLLDRAMESFSQVS